MTVVSSTRFNQHQLDRWRRAITAAFALGGIAVTSWGPRLPSIKTDLGFSTRTIGVLLATVTIGAIAGLVSSSRLLGLLGSRRSVTVSLLVVAVAMAIMGLAISRHSVPGLTVAFLTVGFGIGSLDVLINVEGSANERADGRTLLPRMHAAWSIGAIAGGGIGAAAAGLGIAPSVQFVVEAVGITAVGLVIAPAIPAGTRAKEKSQPSSDVGPAGTLRLWWKQWMDWRLLAIGVVMLGVEVGEGSANTWLTLAMHADHGQSAAIAAVFFTVFASTEAIARIFGGPAVDRLGRVTTVRVTTALGVLGLVVFILGTSRWLVLVGVALWGLGVSMGFPLGMSSAAESGRDAARRVSVVATIGYFANLAGPPVIGSIAGSTGLLSALWLVAAFMLLACVMAGAVRRPATTSAHLDEGKPE